MKARVLALIRVTVALSALLLPGAATAQVGGSAGAGGTGGTGGTPRPGDDAGGSASRRDTGLPIIESVSRQDVVRGSPVTVEGRNLGTDPKIISLFLDEVPIGNPVVADGDSFTFIVPAEVGPAKERRPLRLGPALLRVSIESPKRVSQMAADPYDQGQLHVRADVKQEIELTGISPRAVTRGDVNQVTLLGSHFPARGRDLAFLVDGVEVPLCWDGKESNDCAAPKATITAHQLVISGKLDPAIWSGTHKLALRLGEQDATAPHSFTLTEYDSAGIRWRAIALGVALLAAVMLIAMAGGTYATRRTRYILRAFLIDAETEAYSLSKLQFFAWSVAALLGYCYLALSHFLVQEKFELPSVPEGLPLMLGMSAGTAVLSIGITSAKGPKASGDAEPGFSDLISVGGLVSPERFQFFLWTCVSIAAFLFSALRMDPLQINELPKIPDSLLTLSGVSSAGFLGGKLVRGPGPVISEVLASGGSLVLTVLGRNLDRFARFEINGKSITALLPAGPEQAPRAETLEPEAGGRSHEFAKSIKIVLEKPAEDWLRYPESPPKLELSVVNQDGQRAAYELEVPADTWQAFIASAASPSATAPPPSTAVAQPEAISADRTRPVNEP